MKTKLEKYIKLESLEARTNLDFQ